MEIQWIIPSNCFIYAVMQSLEDFLFYFCVHLHCLLCYSKRKSFKQLTSHSIVIAEHYSDYSVHVHMISIRFWFWLYKFAIIVRKCKDGCYYIVITTLFSLSLSLSLSCRVTFTFSLIKITVVIYRFNSKVNISYVHLSSKVWHPTT